MKQTLVQGLLLVANLTITTIMKLPVFQKKTTQPKTFLACQIEESSLQLAVWEIKDNARIHILKISTPKEWLDLPTVSDAFEVALEELGETAVSVNDVLFGFPPGWIENDDVKPEFKNTIKKLSQKLSLKAAGFVVSVEALAQHLLHQGVLGKAGIILQIFPNAIHAFRTDHGQITQQEMVGRTENSVDDLREAVVRLKVSSPVSDIFLSSPILTESEVEQMSQDFLAHPWDKEKIFAQLPKTTVLKNEEVLTSICEQGGKEVAKSLGLIPSNEPAPVASAKTDSPQEKADTKSFGIPVAPTVPLAPVAPHPTEQLDKITLEEPEPEPVPKKKLRKWKWQWKRLLAFQTGKGRTIAIAGGVGSLVILIAGYLLLLSQVKAVVTIVPQKSSVSKDITITLDPEAEATSPESNTLKVDQQDKSLQITQEISTTGTKIIGDKATGTVTIVNKTEGNKSFPKGTELITGDKKYAFLLDEDVEVASASSKEEGDQKILDFGKKDAKVTAKQIGIEYNLAKDTEFTIANFGKDTYSAKNSAAFEGGTSREIQAVSKTDQQKLRGSAIDDGLKQAEEELEQEAGDGEYVVLTGKYSVEGEKFSAKVDDEVNTLSITLDLEVEAYTYQGEDIQPIAEVNLKSQLPAEGELIQDSLNILSKANDTASDSAKVTLQATLSSDYQIKLNEESLKAEIAGRTPEQVAQSLADKDSIKSASVEISPKFIGFIMGKVPKAFHKIVLQIAPPES